MTTDSKPDVKVTELIRACLALSHSSNEHEASLAMSKAMELLEKYNLDMADFESHNSERPVVHIDLPLDDFGDSWKRQLMYSIALVNFCEGVRIGDTLHILGRPQNVIATTDMGYWLIDSIEALSYPAIINRPAGINHKTYRNSWLMGCVDRVVTRVKALRVDRESVTPNLHALVVTLKQETESYMYQQYPNLRHIHSHSRIDSSAYRDGQLAGGTVGLFRQQKVNNSGQHLLS